MARTLTPEQARRRALRKKLGISDVRTASRKQISRARSLGALPGRKTGKAGTRIGLPSLPRPSDAGNFNQPKTVFPPGPPKPTPTPGGGTRVGPTPVGPGPMPHMKTAAAAPQQAAQPQFNSAQDWANQWTPQQWATYYQQQKAQQPQQIQKSAPKPIFKSAADWANQWTPQQWQDHYAGKPVQQTQTGRHGRPPPAPGAATDPRLQRGGKMIHPGAGPPGSTGGLTIDQYEAYTGQPYVDPFWTGIRAAEQQLGPYESSGMSAQEYASLLLKLGRQAQG